MIDFEFVTRSLTTSQVVSLDHSEDQPGAADVTAEVAVNSSFEVNGSGSDVVSKSLDVLPSWQRAQIRRQEESSRCESGRQRLTFYLHEDPYSGFECCCNVQIQQH